ncbi:hypothetical protein AA313_de0201745 [Arthrobotrys entomopaga]|nr:hypothetical protein AA313_de0201745 [Arthrobotrys entomopaga]
MQQRVPHLKRDSDGNQIYLQKESISSFSDCYLSEILTVVVGKDSKRFNLHTSAVACSSYFQGLLKSSMKEAREKLVTLNDDVDDPEAFKMFNQYCYLQDYFCDEDGPSAVASHAKVYVLAERLGCLPLKDLAFQKASLLLHAVQSKKPSGLSNSIATAVAVIFEHTYEAEGAADRHLGPILSKEVVAANVAPEKAANRGSSGKLIMPEN